MDIGAALVADSEAAEAIEPGERPFDHPAMPTEPLARLDATPGDPQYDPALAAGSTAARVVVAFVGMQFGRTTPWPPTAPTWLADRWDGIEGRLQQL